MCHVAESAADPANYILGFIPDIPGLTQRRKKDQRADRREKITFVSYTNKAKLRAQMDLRFHISYSQYPPTLLQLLDSLLGRLIPIRCPKHYIVVIWDLAESEQHLRCEPELLSTIRSRSERAPRPPGAYVNQAASLLTL